MLVFGAGARRRSDLALWGLFAAMLFFPVLAGPAAARSLSENPSEIPHYELFIGADPTQPVRIRLHIPPSQDVSSVFFVVSGEQVPRPPGLLAVVATDGDGQSVPLTRTSSGLVVGDGSTPRFIDYELHLHPSLLKPASWPNNHPPALRWDDYVYVTGHALLRWPNARGPVGVTVHAPAGWRLFTPHAGVVPATETIYIPHVDDGALIAGPDIWVAEEVGGVRLIRVGTLPWSDQDVSDALATMLTPLRRRHLVDAGAEFDAVIVRYPGALRFNPFISARAVGHHTLIQWVGVGSFEWWLLHTAAEIAAAAVDQSVDLADDAAWFRHGIGGYAGLLMLYETGQLTSERLYQSLRTMFATGVRYSGRLWPSLLSAGLAEAGTYEAERVLQFRGPVVAFLLDLELRERTGGAVTLLDWWAALAEGQRQNPQGPLHTEDLWPPVHLFGDMSDFARTHIFETDDLSIEFESIFGRWLRVADALPPQ